MNWSLVEIKNALAIANVIVTFILAIYTWQLRKHKANHDAIADLKHKTENGLEDLTDRMTIIETTVKHLPDAESIGKVHARQDKTNETLHEVVGTLTGLTNQVAMLNQHLLEQAKK